MGWSEWRLQFAGDGGIAGQGGEIYAYNQSKIYAFNGNRYTDGTNYNNGLNQAYIYAQNGELRAIYKYNLQWNERDEFTYAYLAKLFGSDIESSVASVEKPTKDSERANILVRKAKTCSLSGYTNPTTNNTQGIGSGAGYIELSNGHFYDRRDN